MSSAPPSQTSTPSGTGHATQPSISEPTTNGKRSWVWAFFSKIDPQHVECNVINATGTSCRKKLKRDKTGSTNGKGHNNTLLEKFVLRTQSKKSLSIETLKTALVYFICECDLPLSITESPSFRRLLELCNPSILNILVKRTAITAHLSHLFYHHQEHIRKIFSKDEMFISFTTF
ncbi:hypothetical protein O181_095831 [Austropuccinia psidii MF-1]|uniref:BED-type domain-containing protein n=1 Tax=Austropuccinia psidii MF-1 TaxID=1389203 RepID=A0A9Q3PDP7_9BASI|nr:hypothetical protein [Austropuccinia psidii MF-1]